MNPSKIAFITCVNDDVEYAEACRYIKRLHVPDGYETDIIGIHGASSMAAGYNEGMEKSDAKYKVYLHQDTFILNKNFLDDMLALFKSDDRIGMMGVVGATDIPSDGRAINNYNAGFAYCNGMNTTVKGRQNEDGTPLDVRYTDGLLLVTQADVRWRDDIFDGWDYYDVSQDCEMLRHGYRVVMPYQRDAWCYHDSHYTNLINYDKYCKRFVEEYGREMCCVYSPESEENQKNYEMFARTVEMMENLMRAGMRETVDSIFADEKNCGFIHLQQYELCAKIDIAERAAGQGRFWQDNDSRDDVIHRLAVLRHALKRREYGTDDDGSAETLIAKYSRQAVALVQSYYREGDWDGSCRAKGVTE